jgi:diaminohydroxyphosphoribosylaminopyrimidine deaminase/5-amino-6-(5-phosphoribosylamino)uracil reductase
MPDNDERWMARALMLGRRAMGASGENPAVGCVIVAGGYPAGLGWTGEGGRPHAEPLALAMAGAAARGATAYVSLEPCAHHGRTPPCAEALAKAGVARVVTAMEDPDPRVSGRGHAILRAAGITVEAGVLADEARRDLAGFLSRITAGRPHVMLKLAMSRDGMIAAERGRPNAITGGVSRARVHLMRARADAIMVGVSTVVADDPLLTCRLPGLEQRSPVRVVSDSRLSIPLSSRLIATAGEVPVWLLATVAAPGERASALAAAGAGIIACKATGDGKVDLADALEHLAARGINRVMVEGGAHLARALIAADLVDEAVFLTAPLDLGEGGLPALAGLDRAAVTASPDFTLVDEEKLGADTLKAYERSR